MIYPDKDWKDAVFHEDHIFPKSLFSVRDLKKRGYDDATIETFLASYNQIPNLQLLTETENLTKNAAPFDDWITTREEPFRKRHLIPDVADLGMDGFAEFFAARRALMKDALGRI